MGEVNNCYRISAKLAGDLSTAWDKTINGVNDNCEVSTMDMESALEFLKDKEPKDILCLGATTGKMTQLLNDLEENYPDRFNKKTVYAKIHETDGGATQPNSKTAVFTTFDGCKGMERPICIVFDWTYSYWQARLKKDVDAKILRNIFCVAASRGKDRIIFVRDDNPRDRLVTPNDLRFPVQCTANTTGVLMDTMFDFNPRRNEAYRIPVSRIPRNIIYAVEKDVIGYEPEQCLA